MWFVFPQLKGLGTSEMANGIVEAKAYLAHPVLGARLQECTGIVNRLAADTTAVAIFSMVDALKFRSCMTLFELIAEGGPEFAQALERYFDGERDARTLALTSR